MSIKHTKGPQRKLVAVLGETKTGIYYPALTPAPMMRSVYVSASGTAVPCEHTLEALAGMRMHTPIHEGDTITFQF
jgi:hypothetical protein